LRKNGLSKCGPSRLFLLLVQQGHEQAGERHTIAERPGRPGTLEQVAELAIDFYRKCGWRIVEPVAVGDGNDEATVLTKVLAGP
jgi:hypothetical protein